MFPWLSSRRTDGKLICSNTKLFSAIAHCCHCDIEIETKELGIVRCRIWEEGTSTSELPGYLECKENNTSGGHALHKSRMQAGGELWRTLH